MESRMYLFIFLFADCIETMIPFLWYLDTHFLSISLGLYMPLTFLCQSMGLESRDSLLAVESVDHLEFTEVCAF